MDFVHISCVLIFANGTQKKISRVFNFAKSTKIREIRENLYTRKLVRLRYYELFLVNNGCDISIE